MTEKDKPLAQTALPTSMALFGNLVLAGKIEQGGIELMHKIRARGLSKAQASDSGFAKSAQKALSSAHQASVQIQTAIKNATSVMPPVALEKFAMLKGVGKFVVGASPLGRLSNLYTIYDIAQSTGALDKLKDGASQLWSESNTFATELYSPHRDYFARLGSDFAQFSIQDRNFRTASPFE